MRDQPGWITFSLDGRYAYPSTGEVIDTTKKIVAALKDEERPRRAEREAARDRLQRRPADPGGRSVRHRAQRNTPDSRHGRLLMNQAQTTFPGDGRCRRRSAGVHPLDQSNLAQSPPREKGPRIGTVTYNIAKDWDIPTIIKNLTDAGMHGVELRTTHAHGVEMAIPAGERAEVRKRFEDSPIALAGLGTICEYQSPDPAIVRKNIEETKAWVKLAHDVGSPGVKVRPNGLPSDVPEEKTLEQIGRALNVCGAAAADQGVKIQLEVHGEGTSRVPRIRKILGYADNHPAVGLLELQPGGSPRRGPGAQLPAPAVADRAGAHARSVPGGVSVRGLIRLLTETEFEGLLLRRNPSVR